MRMFLVIHASIGEHRLKVADHLPHLCDIVNWPGGIPPRRRDCVQMPIEQVGEIRRASPFPEAMGFLHPASSL